MLGPTANLASSTYGTVQAMLCTAQLSMHVVGCGSVGGVGAGLAHMTSPCMHALLLVLCVDCCHQGMSLHMPLLRYLAPSACWSCGVAPLCHATPPTHHALEALTWDAGTSQLGLHPCAVHAHGMHHSSWLQGRACRALHPPAASLIVTWGPFHTACCSRQACFCTNLTLQHRARHVLSQKCSGGARHGSAMY